MCSCAISSAVLLLVLLVTLAAASPRQLHSVTPCILTKTSYHPSPLEFEWSSGVADWAHPNNSRAQYCAHVTPHKKAIKTWLGRMKEAFSVPEDKECSELYSHFKYQYTCGSKTITQHAPIEPLFGSLRHPLFACGAGDYHLDKDYMLLQSASGAPVTLMKDPKVFIFDLGASTYTSGIGGASQQWFVEQYMEHGFTLDGYYGWEAKLRSPRLVFAEVPKHLLHHYLYFNIPAVTGKNDPANPLNIMKAAVQASDFVVLKIDIDNPPAELEFIRQILEDTSISSLIDEFFFEHHVNFRPMHVLWQKTNSKDEKQLLSDSYSIFSRLRNLGIRAHGWV